MTSIINCIQSILIFDGHFIHIGSVGRNPCFRHNPHFSGDKKTPVCSTINIALLKRAIHV